MKIFLYIYKKKSGCSDLRGVLIKLKKRFVEQSMKLSNEGMICRGRSGIFG